MYQTILKVCPIGIVPAGMPGYFHNGHPSAPRHVSLNNVSYVERTGN